MNYFEGLDPRITERMSIDVLDNDDAVLPAAYQVFIRENPSEASLTAPFFDKDAQAAYVAACKGMLTGSGEDLLKEIGATPENRSGVMLAQASIAGVLDESWSPEIGRPQKVITSKLGNAAGVMPFINAARKQSPSDDALAQNVMSTQMGNLTRNLEALHWMFFEQTCADGRPSVGWLNEDEKTNFLKALALLGSDARREALRALWAGAKVGGDPTEFDGLWTTWTATLEEWGKRFDAISFNGSLEPMGEETSNLFLARWGIRSQVKDLIPLLDEDLGAIESEILRVEALPKQVAKRPKNDAEAMTEARAAAHSFKAKLVDTEVLPQRGADYDADAVPIRFKAGAELLDAAIATTTIRGDVLLFPHEGHEAFWAQYGGDVGPTMRHELAHSWQYRQLDEAHRNRWGTMFSKEAGAMALEDTRLFLEEDVSNDDVLVALKDAQRRTSLLKTALRLHNRTIDRNTALEEIRAIAPDESVAARFLSRMEAGPWDFGQYWLASKLFANFVDADHAGDVKAGLKDYAHRSDLLLPAHVIQSGFVPVEHEVKSAVPFSVRVAREKFPVLA